MTEESTSSRPPETVAAPGPLARLVPTMPRIFALLVNGVVWAAVGVLLTTLGIHWESPEPTPWPELVLGSALALGIVLYALLFRRIVAKNLRRYETLPPRIGVLAFTSVTGWLMVGLMMPMGWMLRHSSIPKTILSFPYAMMGTMLLIGSVPFFRSFLARTLETVDR